MGRASAFSPGPGSLHTQGPWPQSRPGGARASGTAVGGLALHASQGPCAANAPVDSGNDFSASRGGPAGTVTGCRGDAGTVLHHQDRVDAVLWRRIVWHVVLVGV